MRADTIIFFVLDYHYQDVSLGMSEMDGIMISGAFTDQDSNGYNYKNNGVYTYHPTAATLDNVGSQTRNYHFVDKRMFPNMILGDYWINVDASNPAQCGLHYSGDDSGTGTKYTGSSNAMLYLIIGDNSISAEGSLILHFAIIIALVLIIFLLWQ